MPNTNIVMRQLVALTQMGLKELQEKYEEMYGQSTDIISLRSLRQKLAYRIQEVYYGGLNDREKERLELIAQRDPVANLELANLPKDTIPRGTRFSREWHGKVYEVIATGSGTYEYAGQYYRSLSSVATAITGTKWNGNKFFGVKK